MPETRVQLIDHAGPWALAKADLGSGAAVPVLVSRDRVTSLSARPETAGARTVIDLQDWEKAWAVDPRSDIFAEREIDGRGAIVIVRPDQHVANVLPLTARAELTAFFAGFLVDQQATVMS